MINNNSAILDALSAGATLLTPDAARARRLRRSVGLTHLARGQRLWRTPDVLSLGAWCHRELERARRDGRLRCRLLGATEEWLLWRDAIAEAGADLGAVSAESLVAPLRRAAFLLEEWQIPLPSPVTPESALLLNASRGFRRRCRDLDAMTASSWARWRLAQGQSHGDNAVRLAGFEPLGPQLRRALTTAGAEELLLPSSPGAGQVIRFASAEAELAGAADWARASLLRNSAARLLIVVPDLAQRAAALRRCLDAALSPEELLAGAVGAAHDLLVPDALACARVIVTALQWLRLNCGGLTMDELSALLCSPYLPGDPSARALIDRRLRELKVLEADRAVLWELRPAIPAALGAAYAALLEALGTGTHARAGSDAWSARFSHWLRQAGWPGPAALSAVDQLAIDRFAELLREFAVHCQDGGAMNGGAALALFTQLLAQAEPLGGDCDRAVQVTASLGHPLANYDGIWVCGLSDSLWPAAAAPDPFIPLPLQRAAGIEPATAEGQLRAARRQLAQWRSCTPELRCSWAAAIGDIEQSISPLLAAFAPVAASLPTGADALTLALRGAAPLAVSAVDTGSGAPSQAEVLAGGTRVLELMALCPFQAHAVHRLCALELEQPAPGLCAREQGQSLHAALQLLWSRVGGLEQARAMDHSAATAAVSSAAREAVELMRRQRCSALPELVWQVERARLEQLLGREFEAELQRGPFVVLGTEVRTQLSLAGTHLNLRIDRIDELPDGTLAIIDYKSGRPQPFDSLAEPPGYPQLLAYALAQDQAVSAVAALHVRSDGIDWRRDSDRVDRLVAKKSEAGAADPEWAGRRARWHASLERLLAGFRAGQADVTPAHGACRNCSLPAFCRITPARRLAHVLQDEEREQAEPGAPVPEGAAVGDGRADE